MMQNVAGGGSKKNQLDLTLSTWLKEKIQENFCPKIWKTIKPEGTVSAAEWLPLMGQNLRWNHCLGMVPNQSSGLGSHIWLDFRQGIVGTHWNGLLPKTARDNHFQSGGAKASRQCDLINTVVYIYIHLRMGGRDFAEKGTKWRLFFFFVACKKVSRCNRNYTRLLYIYSKTFATSSSE